MATAPTPGVGRRSQETKTNKAILQITLKGETKLIAPNNLPFAVNVKIRKACGGMPLLAFWNGETAIGEDSLQVLWWAARLVNGEPNLTLDTCLEEWPEDLSAEEIAVKALGDEDQAEIVEAAGENPES